MSTKTISGAYAHQFQFTSPYTTLSITSTGYVGSGGGAISGRPDTQAYTVVNDGRVDGSIYLGTGGVVTNGAVSNVSAEIIGGYGVFIRNAVGAVANYGSIIGTNGGTEAGVYLNDGGSVINGAGVDTTAIIRGGYGVWIRNASGSVTNFGSIIGGNPAGASGGNGEGILLSDGGQVTNGTAVDRTALIDGNGVVVMDAPGTVLNFGTILSTDPLSGYGVALFAGGAITNGSATDRTALIEGYETGAEIRGAGTIKNFGTIAGEGEANGARSIYLGGGSLTNGGGSDHGALIEGYGGVEVDGAAAVGNFGTILADSGAGYGLQFQGGGTLNNGAVTDTAALIEGNSGLAMRGATGANLGTIAATGLGSGLGARLDGTGSSLVNGAAGQTAALIEGYTGAYLAGTSTLTNFGTIDGLGGVAVELAAATDTLQVAAGSVFEGSVTGGGGALGLITGSGTISGVSGGDVTVSGSMATTTFTNFATLEVGFDAQFTLLGNASIASGEALGVAGALAVAGTISLAGSLVTFGTLSGAGTLAISGGTAAFDTGTSLAIAKVTVAGAATAVTVATGLTYVGAFTQTAGTVSVSAGDKLTFTGPADSFAGTLTGAGAAAFTGGADMFASFTLSTASATISNAAVTLSGAITLGHTLTVTTPSLIIATAGASLTGGGELLLSGVATNAATGASATATLTNVNDKLVGSGALGNGKMILVNQSSGTIDGNGAVALTVNTGTSTIANSGLMEGGGTGGLIIQSAINNTGTLSALGSLTVNAAVSGAGTVRVSGGTADFASSFTENVIFVTSGELELAKSQTYAGTINGFSKTGGTTLDLQDISFGTGTKATYSGTATAGTLTITDGIHTAKIKLSGNYTTSTFDVSSDEHGGTMVVDPTPPAQARQIMPAPPHPFIAAMAGFGAATGGALNGGGEPWGEVQPTLAASRGRLA